MPLHHAPIPSPLLPNPTPYGEPLLDDAALAEHRVVACPWYAQCLDRSVREGWEGFSCQACALKRMGFALPRSDPWAEQRQEEPFQG